MHFWLWVNFSLTIALFTVTGWFLVRRARRERRLTPELALYVATLTLGWMEAVIDWGAFVYYSPEWPHFPTDWPVVRLIPILPLHIPLCYTWFFFGGAWMGMRLARALTTRFTRMRMGPMLIVCGLVVGFLLDIAVESFFISVGGLWTYTQTWGPLTWHAGADNQWPVYMGFAMALTIAPITYLFGTRDDRGEDVVAATVRRITAARTRAAPAPLVGAPSGASSGVDRRGRSAPAVVGMNLAVAGAARAATIAAPAAPSGDARGAPTGRTQWLLYLVSWVVVVHVIYGAVSLGYATLRWTGLQTTVSTVKPYPDAKPWFDGDITKRGDPSLPRHSIDAAVDDDR